MMKLGKMLLSGFRLMLFSGVACCTAAASAAAQPEQSLQLLLITVMRTDDATEARKLLEPDTEEGTQVRRWSSRRPHGEDHSVQVQVLEGETAFVHLGKTVPDVQILGVEGRPGHRRVVPYVRPVNREYGQDFHVQAEVADNNVVLNLFHYSEMPRAESAMSTATQALRTTVSGRIGQWLDAGGSLGLSPDPDEPSAAVRTYSAGHIDKDATRLLIRVELVK